jgi:hypothetical protein
MSDIGTIEGQDEPSNEGLSIEFYENWAHSLVPLCLNSNIHNIITEIFTFKRLSLAIKPTQIHKLLEQILSITNFIFNCTF